MLRRSISVEGRHATRGITGDLPGANGSFLRNMFQIAVLNSRAISTRATLLPRWRGGNQSLERRRRLTYPPSVIPETRSEGSSGVPTPHLPSLDKVPEAWQ